MIRQAFRAVARKAVSKMAKPAYDVIIVGAGADSNIDWIDSSRSENPQDSLARKGQL